MTTVYLLGSSAAVPTADRDNTALLLASPVQTVLVDCGGGIMHALVRSKVPLASLSDLLITHAHIDHINGFPSLVEGLRLSGRTTAPLRVWGLDSVLDVAKRLLEVFAYELRPGKFFPIDYHRLAASPGQVIADNDIWRITTAPMEHSLPSLGVRVDTRNGRRLTYSCDTRPCPALLDFARGSHTLIQECTYLAHKTEQAQAHGHTTTAQAGEVATSCGVHRLILAHLGLADGWSEEEARAEVSRTFTGKIEVARDGAQYEI